MHTGLVVMLINKDPCPILSFLCVETEGTDFYQHNKHFRSVNAYQLLLIFRINLISFIHFQFESERVFIADYKTQQSVKTWKCAARLNDGNGRDR